MSIKLKVYLNYLFLISLISFVKSANKLTFPQVDNFEEECIMDDGTRGSCLNIRWCPAAQTAGTTPKTCYFEGFEHIVCCPFNELQNDQERVSQKQCKIYYPDGVYIIRGLRTTYNEFPYMIALGWETFMSDAYDYKCGGVLISEKYVLTAAHCCLYNGLQPVVALPHGVNLTDSSVQPIKIARIITHPQYKKPSVYNDIALIELQVTINRPKPACLWTSFELQDTNVTAIGYGHTKFGGPSSKQLLKTHLNVIPNKECQLYYERQNTIPRGIVDHQMCAKDPQQLSDTCQGDSGGPLIQAVMENPYAVGITSFGQGCGKEEPGVYTRISEYLDWIESTVWAERKN